MAFLGISLKRNPAKKAEKHAYKLAKQAQRQQAKTDRVNARQGGRTDRAESQDAADSIAYMNGMQPVNRAADIISAGGKAATGIMAGMAGAGIFGNEAAILNTGQGRNREIEFSDDGEMTGYTDKATPFGKGNNMIMIIGGAVLLIVVLLMGKKR